MEKKLGMLINIPRFVTTVSRSAIPPSPTELRYVDTTTYTQWFVYLRVMIYESGNGIERRDIYSELNL